MPLITLPLGLSDPSVFCIHFIGIGGIGMNGLAQLCLGRGYRVQGSNTAASDLTQALAQQGATIFAHHAPDRLGPDVQLVVVSSAISSDNPEWRDAQDRGIPVIHRSECLRLLLQDRQTIGISGTHGKTTTTSLLGFVLANASQDPMIVSGGIMQAYGSTVLAGQGPFAVVEADESDKSHINFDSLHAGLITNIEPEHMTTYHDDPALLYTSFQKFVDLCQSCVVVCSDDAGVRTILDQRRDSGQSASGAPILTYGVGADALYRACKLRTSAQGMVFDIIKGQDVIAKDVAVALWGQHNVLNALGVWIMAQACGLSTEAIRKGLATFSGVHRRMTPVGSLGSTLILDDYAHHPTEIAAVLAALRQRYPSGRILAVCQPHRYTRLRDTMALYPACLEQADQVVVLPVYGAGEAPLEGVSSQALADRLQDQGKPVVCLGEDPASFQDLKETILSGAWDVAVCMGAGSITTLAKSLGMANDPISLHPDFLITQTVGAPTAAML